MYWVVTVSCRTKKAVAPGGRRPWWLWRARDSAGCCEARLGPCGTPRSSWVLRQPHLSPAGLRRASQPLRRRGWVSNLRLSRRHQTESTVRKTLLVILDTTKATVSRAIEPWPDRADSPRIESEVASFRKQEISPGLVQQYDIDAVCVAAGCSRQTSLELWILPG